MGNLTKGTKVRVKEDLVVDEFYGGFRFHNGMAKYAGKDATIAAMPHYNKTAYKIDIDFEGYDWSVGMFDVVS